MDIKQKELIDRYLQEKYNTSLSELEKRIKTEVIDYSGTLTGCFLNVLIYRWYGTYHILYGISESSYRKLDEDVKNNAFQYYFPIYYYKDLPTGKHLREQNLYELPSLFHFEDGKVLRHVFPEDVENSLINDLENEKSFQDDFNKFLTELYNWI